MKRLIEINRIDQAALDHIGRAWSLVESGYGPGDRPAEEGDRTPREAAVWRLKQALHLLETGVEESARQRGAQAKWESRRKRRKEVLV